MVNLSRAAGGIAYVAVSTYSATQHQEATEIGFPLAPMDGILPSTPTWSASSPMDLRKPSTIFVSASVSCFRSQYSPLMVSVGEEKAPELLNSSGRRIV